MKNFISAGLVLAFAVCSAGAMELNGAKIKVTAGEHSSKYVPVSVPFEGDAPEGNITLSDEAGRTYPGTVRNGELVFVLDKLRPKMESTLTVQVGEATKAPQVQVEKNGDLDEVGVSVGGEKFTAYHYSNDNKKPFMWPVLSEGGVPVTRSFPMEVGDTPKAMQDHPHHRSLWTSYGDVNGADCWMEEATAGFQHSGEVTWGSGNAYGWIRAKNVWQNNAQEDVVNEEREYRIYATPAKARLMDVRVTFTADKGDVIFGDTKEGGLVSVRMRPELSGRNAVITNAEGDKGEPKCWGKPSPWCDFTGELPDAGFRGITIMDNPGNMRYPTSWHVRAYGLMGANCFGYSYFNEKDYNKGLMPENGDFILKQGESATFNYRVYIHSEDVDTANVAERFSDYATPPQAEWVQ